MPWTTYAKRQYGLSMYSKGKNFLGAAVLLQRHGGHQYVVLHLICQGIEAALKGLLLIKDFDRFRPLMRRYGHNLTPLIRDALNEFGLAQMRPSLSTELKSLSNLYLQHLLRYGSFYDLIVDPDTIPIDLVIRRVTATLRLGERELR